ncbi:hypothetical protein C5167_010702, partial [Papaver somniferum]
MSISKLSGFGKLVLESILRTCTKHVRISRQKFEQNPFFENVELSREFSFSHKGTIDISFTEIKWKDKINGSWSQLWRRSKFFGISLCCSRGTKTICDCFNCCCCYSDPPVQNIPAVNKFPPSPPVYKDKLGPSGVVQ